MGVQMVFAAFGGVGLFLYGMAKMGEGLQKAAGERMRHILEALTVNRLASVTVGILVTAVIQSSAATAVMCVSFVNTGLMALEQAISVIMGANIGTTITAQMVAFNLSQIALPAIALGMIMKLLGKRKDIKGFGDCLLGFGMLFLGITIVGDSLEPLKFYKPFLNLMSLGTTNPLSGILVGALFTTILQSSSAVTGLLVTMASRGILNLEMALPIILGANIGTTSTALISSIGTSLTARRTALAHFLFNVFGTFIFIPFLGPFGRLASKTSFEISRQIANAHSLFNVSVTLLLLPVVPQFAVLVRNLLKGDESVIELGPKYLDVRLISTPFMAVMQTKKEVMRIANLCLENLETAVAVFRGDKTKDKRRFYDIEDTIDEVEKAMSYYVAKVSQHDVTDHEARILTSAINVCANLERIGDHANSIINLAEYSSENNLFFSKEGLKELDEMFFQVIESVTIAIDALETGDKVKASKIVIMDDVLDDMERNLRAKHIKRLNEGVCYPASGVVYLDMLSHLERIGDHAVNIAEEVMLT